MTLDQIKRIIEEHVPDSQAIVLDPYNDGEHLQALVISPEFEGKMLVKQHQMVMKPLKEAFATTVHALGLKTFTPYKKKKVRQEFGY
ncbi:MAG: BolA/IbaG family iron-sulfur metabolism protein [Candidatus Omnitrophica bacterium]|nr:BolA/IbaG family iron-sulfur metabolism protein [Candidatus Omnitrophota bacterium]